jgi:unsaturated rhamnogalacturonyl hydrolase
MGMPFYARCLAETGEDRWDDILDQFQSAHKLLWNESLGLYMHANDCSRKAEWADPVTGQSPAVWLRAEGWFLMALADTYEIASEHSSRAAELIPLLRNAIDGILQYQMPQAKMFLQVVDRADLSGNYSETSGSAMVAYALMKGARLGMLPAPYGERGSEILDAIRDTYLINENGEYHLYGICASAGLGPGPDNRSDRDGTPAYYLSEKQMTDNQHGTGACMMAVSEQLLRTR